MATSLYARFEPIETCPGTNSSYDSYEEIAHLWISKLNTATGAADATAEWSGIPEGAAGAAHTVDPGSAAGVHEGYIDDGTVHILVSGGADTDSTTTVAAVADAIDQAVIGTVTVDGAMTDTTTTTFLIHAGQDTLLDAIMGVDGFVYLKVGDENEIVKVTALNDLTATCERGALGSTPSSSWDNDEALYWYCGPDNSVIGLDDETVWGTPTHLALVCGTEVMHVNVDTLGFATDMVQVTRGYLNTTAAAHADNATVTQYIDADTLQFDVASGAALVDEKFYKAATNGTEVFQIKSISTNRITVERGKYQTVPTAIADGAALYRVWAEDIYDAALTAVNGTSGCPDFKERGIGGLGFQGLAHSYP